MTIYPAIDLFEGKAVRLERGDYAQMTVFSTDPPAVAREFKASGAGALHIVDLEGARAGVPANFDVIQQIISDSGLEVQVGGGIRTADIIKKYLSSGVSRVILGTAAVSSPGFLRDMVVEYGEAISVSADMKDGFIAIKGWEELSGLDVFEFCRSVEDVGVGTLICTDISKDGLLGGTNIELYRTLRERLSIKLIASGGISSIEEIRILSQMGMDGAILGRSLYAGTLVLSEAIAVSTRLL